MKATDVLLDGFDRVRHLVADAAQDLSEEQLSHRPGADANPIGWLLWHLSRVQDDHIAGVADLDQVWIAAGWNERFDLPFDATEIGYGQSSAEVAKVVVRSAQDLVDYHDAVFAQTQRYLSTLADDELSRVVDDSYDPPVTLLVRLVSVLSDDLQHVGQAAYVRGLLR